MIRIPRERWGNFVGGEWVAGSSLPDLPLINPSDGTVIGRIVQADGALADRALSLASGAVEAGLLTQGRPKERMALLLRIARELRDMEDDIAAVECLNNGKPISAARAEASEAARIFEYYAGLADKVEGRSIPLGADYVSFTERLPHGVTLHIVPYNYPLNTAARSVAPALAAGNACVVKAPETSPLGTMILAEACRRAGVPAGSVSFLCGYGVDLGAYLVGHHQIDHIVFTGSVGAGKAVMHAAAETIVPTVMELGGKSAAILLPDADMGAALESVFGGIFCNAGQICSASSRLLVHRSQVDEVHAWFRNRLAAVTIGPANTDPDIGPLISERHRRRVLELLNGAIAEGAELVAGAREAPDLPGFFVRPAVLGRVTPEMTIATTEVFGPVLCVMAYETVDDAVRIANGGPYGLVAGVFTSDLNRAHQIARRMRCGQVFVNEWFAGGIETPFGGVGHSGFGREKGIEGLLNYVRTRTTTIRLGDRPVEAF